MLDMYAYPFPVFSMSFRRLFSLLMLLLPGLVLARGEGLRAERLRPNGDHAQHREMRIREALERGDITPEEANALRERVREARRQRLERWRNLQGQPKQEENDNQPAPPPNPPSAPLRREH